jgi:hypothetical protein
MQEQITYSAIRSRRWKVPIRCKTKKRGQTNQQTDVELKEPWKVEGRGQEAGDHYQSCGPHLRSRSQIVIQYSMHGDAIASVPQVYDDYVFHFPFEPVLALSEDRKAGGPHHSNSAVISDSGWSTVQILEFRLLYSRCEAFSSEQEDRDQILQL